jgi:hypothetical protein
MRELNKEELKQSSGAFWPIVMRVLAPTVMNMIVYSIAKKHKNEEITPEGLGIAVGAGLVSGGIGAAASTAAGGTLAANAVWTPGTTAINISGNLIAKEH